MLQLIVLSNGGRWDDADANTDADADAVDEDSEMFKSDKWKDDATEQK